MTEVPQLPSPSRAQRWWMGQHQQWAESHVEASHLDALYQFGEYVMFVLWWNALDVEAGRVGRCPTCTLFDRFATAYDQAPSQDCPDCYGTTFEGGFRARIIRPAILGDGNEETVDSRRGEVVTDTISLQTTADFYSRSGDLMLRANGERYQLQQMDTVDIRSGFTRESLLDNIGGTISVSRLEDPGSQAYRVPPTDPVILAQMLEEASLNGHLVVGEGRQDLIKEGGYLVPPAA